MRKNTDREPSAQGRRRWHVSAEEWAHTLEVRRLSSCWIGRSMPFDVRIRF